MANYLVTGAEGFIGSALAEKLIAENHKVVTVDNLSTGDFKNIPDQCEYIIGDLSEKDIINKLNKYEFDAIFHIAGQSGGMKSFEDPIYDMNSNIASTILLLEYCRRNNCNKFIYASSMSVYGQKNECPINETDDLDPTSFYAVGKMASEKYMNIYSEEYDIYTIALRLNNVYRLGQIWTI
ncbi:MAG: NAD-dependent epimerase/dehydratase family protein [archaeon]